MYEYELLFMVYVFKVIKLIIVAYLMCAFVVYAVRI